jgi:hypothetical protein
MRILNRTGVPAPIERAARAAFERERERGGARFTVTELICPPQVVELERVYQAEIEVDVADLMYALLGVLMARLIASYSGDVRTQILEAGADLPKEHRRLLKELLDDLGLQSTATPRMNVIAERRLRAHVTIDGGLEVLVSGQMDHVLAVEEPDGWAITDWKVGSVWESMDVKPEREQQLNLYAALLRLNGFTPVVKLENGFVFRDWSKRRARREQDYPQHQFQRIPSPVWTPERAQMFLVERTALQMAAQGDPPECTLGEKWQKPAAWAVMKSPTAKRASAVLYSEREAMEWLGEAKESRPKPWRLGKIEYRPTEPIRCLDYCRVVSFCEQFRREQRLIEPLERAGE